MIDWIEIIKNNKNLEKEKKELFLKTAKAANLMGDEFYIRTLEMLIGFCEDERNQIKFRMTDKKTLQLLPGFRRTDWLEFSNIEEINQKRTEIQQSMLNFNKNAVLVNTANKGEIKDLKEIVGIQAKSTDKQEQIFVYTNVESLFEENKESITHKCLNCGYEQLCTKTFIGLNSEN